MTDALEMFRAMRPSAPGAESEEIRAPASRGSSDLHNLAMVPGSPSYNARIPRPPCWQCGDDHFPSRSYDHDWTPEPPSIHDEPVSATAISRRPPTITEPAPDPSSWKRVALYVGRGDTYVVAVEAAPDWDSLTSFRVPPEQVLPLISMARALGIKIADKTGGDLFMLEEEAVRGQYAQDHERGAAANGSGEPRRPGPGADRPQEDQPQPADSPNGEVPVGSSQRRHSPRRPER